MGETANEWRHQKWLKCFQGLARSICDKNRRLVTLATLWGMMGWTRVCLRHTFLGSGTEEDQDQDGMEQWRRLFGSMVKATRLAQKQTGLSCCCEGSYALMRVSCDGDDIISRLKCRTAARNGCNADMSDIFPWVYRNNEEKLQPCFLCLVSNNKSWTGHNLKRFLRLEHEVDILFLRVPSFKGILKTVLKPFCDRI